MKFGVNSFVWVSPLVTAAVEDLAPKVKDMGFDILELACERPELIDPRQVRKNLSRKALAWIEWLTDFE